MRQGASARTRLLVAIAAGVVVAAAGLRTGRVAPLLGWDAAALTFCAWTWAIVWGMAPAETAEHSQRESPSRAALSAREFRRTALKHAWISFPLVTGIIAASINLVSGLAR